MKILYGIQGTGNGHISRARLLAKYFSKRSDVEVDYLFSGRDPNAYFDMTDFGQYKAYTGLSFVAERGTINPIKTLREAKLYKLYQDIRQLDLAEYDLVVNDFEPISAWAAKYQNKPSLSISHQAAFSENIPQTGNGLIERLVLKYFAPTNYRLGVHWYHFGCNIMPPFIDHQPVNNTFKNNILVYLPFESLDDIGRVLSPLSEYNFVSFHPSVKQPIVTENISWFPPSQMAFKQVLYESSGVITNCGFELTSECLHLGKRLIVKPLAGQFEQLSNAMTLEHLALCQTMTCLDTDIIESWLESTHKTHVQFPQDPNVLIDWLLEKNWQQASELCKTLWQRVNFPPEVQHRLSVMTQNHSSANTLKQRTFN
jgi:uncharacterized protein (TIGR00661 family)